MIAATGRLPRLASARPTSRVVPALVGCRAQLLRSRVLCDRIRVQYQRLFRVIVSPHPQGRVAERQTRTVQVRVSERT